MPMIEGYMFEEHEMIRLAATECMCNLALSPEVGRRTDGGAGQGGGAGSGCAVSQFVLLGRWRSCSWPKGASG